MFKNCVTHVVVAMTHVVVSLFCFRSLCSPFFVECMNEVIHSSSSPPYKQDFLVLSTRLLTFPCWFACACCFETDQDKDKTKYVAMIHVVVLLQITLFPFLYGLHE
jgi:hypothetical protein